MHLKSVPVLFALAAISYAQPPAAQPPRAAAPLVFKDEKAILKVHSLKIDGKDLSYKSHTGFLPIKTESGEIEAQLFYTAYTVDGESKQKRPVTFCFNGGPGAGSLWLHIGAIGPRRVPMKQDGSMPPPPYMLVDNPDTWLDRSDLVFIDPVGTGYSRAKSPDVAKRFFSLRGDIESIGTVIRHWLTENQRWGSPLYLAGESYGTTRAAGLAGYLLSIS